MNSNILNIFYILEYILSLHIKANTKISIKTESDLLYALQDFKYGSFDDDDRYWCVDDFD